MRKVNVPIDNMQIFVGKRGEGKSTMALGLVLKYLYAMRSIDNIIYSGEVGNYEILKYYLANKRIINAVNKNFVRGLNRSKTIVLLDEPSSYLRKEIYAEMEPYLKEYKKVLVFLDDTYTKAYTNDYVNYFDAYLI